ncbi:sugar transferase [Actinomycetospora sp. OC33-EN08]|uniref:Sugar transferase n=1 Tax=Actinomycetospora aurantiaca TaxID=3129233 RepID=A0ABU8MGR1_9PSEU
MTTAPSRTSRIRRTVDVVVVLVLALVAAPIGLVVAGLVLLDSGRPVLFRQRRSGLAGREFDIVKFRTMRPPRLPDEPDAERQSRLGRFLRWSSLDEIPQLWNILVGEMTFIGPRPTLPEQVARYSAHERGRLAVLPGITGWAQVNGRNSLSWPERIELDLWYIEHRSVALDLRILVRTAGRVVRPSGVVGAGGVNPGFPGPRQPLDDAIQREDGRDGRDPTLRAG